MKLELDLSLNNVVLYEGCDINPLSDPPRLHLATPAQEAVDKVKGNLENILRPSTDFDEIVLTGKTTLEMYLVASVYAAPRCKRLVYLKGKKRIVIKVR